MAFTLNTYQQIFDNMMNEKEYMTTLSSLSPYTINISVTLTNNLVSYNNITLNDSIVFTDLTLPTGLVAGRSYYVLSVNVDNTANISESIDGTPISFTTTEIIKNAYKSSYFNEFAIDLTSTSKVSEHRLWAFITAVIISQFELNLNEFRNEINTLKESFSYGSSKWYIEQAKAYQDGDTLIVLDINSLNPYKLGYETIDTSKQIISSCTTSEFSNVIQLKVRRKDTNILSNDELLRFNDYLKRIKVAGTRVVIINYNPDTVKFGIDITYNGQYNLSDIQSSVNLAISDYLNNINFDSYLIFSQLVDKIQSITVKNQLPISDVVIYMAESKNVIVTNYFDILHDINDKIVGKYLSLAGYFTLDTNNSVINYISV